MSISELDGEFYAEGSGKQATSSSSAFKGGTLQMRWSWQLWRKPAEVQY
jgi:hypothetical protein